MTLHEISTTTESVLQIFNDDSSWSLVHKCGGFSDIKEREIVFDDYSKIGYSILHLECRNCHQKEALRI